MLPELIDSTKMDLSERIFITLKRGIISLDIKPRQVLIIGDVAEYYNTSRTPVREALIKLEREGWVEKDGRRGLRVTVPSEGSLMEIVETQAALEAHAASKLAERGVSEDFKRRSQKSFAETERAIAENADNIDDKIEEFTDLIYGEFGNQFFAKVVRELGEKTTRVRKMSLHLGPAPYEKSLEQHRKIIDAIVAGDAELSYKLMYMHTIWFEEGLMSLLNRY